MVSPKALNQLNMTDEFCNMELYATNNSIGQSNSTY